MNKCETLVKDYLESQGYSVKRMPPKKPDFFVEKDGEAFYVEVKNQDTGSMSKRISLKQEHFFANIQDPIFIYKVSGNSIVAVLKFIPLEEFKSNCPFKSINVKIKDDLAEYHRRRKGHLDWEDYISEVFNALKEQDRRDGRKV